MSLLQILILLFVLFAASRAVLRFHDRSISYGAFLFWSIIWGAVLFLSFNPSLADTFALKLGVAKGTDIAFFLSNIALFYLVFRLYIRLDDMDKKLTELNSESSQAIHLLNKK
jgi:small membrane protein